MPANGVVGFVSQSRLNPPCKNRPSHQSPAMSAPVATPASGQRKFPCETCGARLDFDPSMTELKCPYCGHTKRIYTDYTPVQERDYSAAIEAGGQGSHTIAGRSSQVRCTGCGAVVLLEDNVV